MMNELWTQLTKAYENRDYRTMHVLAKSLEDLTRTTQQVPNIGNVPAALKICHMLSVMALGCEAFSKWRPKLEEARRTRTPPRKDDLFPAGTNNVSIGESDG